MLNIFKKRKERRKKKRGVLKNEVKAKAGKEDNALKKEGQAEMMNVWERKRT